MIYVFSGREFVYNGKLARRCIISKNIIRLNLKTNKIRKITRIYRLYIVNYIATIRLIKH